MKKTPIPMTGAEVVALCRLLSLDKNEDVTVEMGQALEAYQNAFSQWWRSLPWYRRAWYRTLRFLGR